MTACRCHRDSVPCVTRISFSRPNQSDTGTGRDAGHTAFTPRTLGTIFVSPRIFWLTCRQMYGVIMVTHMARRRGDGAADPKVAALRAAGALHPHPEAVHDDAFVRHPFFDPRDRVQVKYEMLRRHRVDGHPVTQVAASFSISRQAFYEALTAFTAMGLPGLVPKRPGPKRAHKCTDAILDFAERWQADEHAPSAARVAAAIRQQFHVTIHPRSLQRALARRKKKRHAPETSR
jgi:transposase